MDGGKSGAPPGPELMMDFDYDDHSNTVFMTLFLLSAVILVLIFKETCIKHVEELVPESLLLLLVGVAFGALSHYLNWQADLLYHVSSKSFFHFLIPPIILDCTYMIYRPDLLLLLDGMLLFGIVGTLFNIFAIGASLHLVNTSGVTLLEGILFGCMVASVDPCGILSALRGTDLHRPTFVMIFGDSLLNNSIAVALSQIIMRIVYVHELDGSTYVIAVLALFMSVCGGMLIGVAHGLLCSFATRFTSEKSTGKRRPWRFPGG